MCRSRCKRGIDNTLFKIYTEEVDRDFFISDDIREGNNFISAIIRESDMVKRIIVIDLRELEFIHKVFKKRRISFSLWGKLNRS